MGETSPSLLNNYILHLFAYNADTLCLERLLFKLVGLELFLKNLDAALLNVIELEGEGLAGIDVENLAALGSKEVVAVHDEGEDLASLYINKLSFRVAVQNCKENL